MEPLFHRSVRGSDKNWLGIRHWFALASCSTTIPWLRLGGQLALRRCSNGMRSFNPGPVVTQICCILVAAAAAVAMP